jgi:hypothetical protein
MIKKFFFGIRDSLTLGDNNRYTMIPDYSWDNLDIELIKSYFKYDLSELRNIFSTIQWMTEDNCPTEGMNTGDRRRYINRHKNASILIFVLIMGSNKAVYELDKEIVEENNRDLKRYEKRMFRLTGDDYYKSKGDYTYDSNIELENGKHILKLINQTDYLNDNDWEYGFVFNLDKYTLEIHSRKLMEQNGADNMIWKVITRDTEFDAKTFELE